MGFIPHTIYKVFGLVILCFVNIRKEERINLLASSDTTYSNYYTYKNLNQGKL